MLVHQPNTSENLNNGSLAALVAERASSMAVDLTVLASFDEAQEAGEPDFVVELIDIYLGEAPQRFEAIRMSVAKADSTLLKQAAHTLKGSSASLGIREVAQICEKLEQVEFADHPQSMEALVQLLLHKFAKARAVLLTERERRLRESSNS